MDWSNASWFASTWFYNLVYSGLIDAAPLWTRLGIGGILGLFTFSRAVKWQRQHIEPPIPWRQWLHQFSSPRSLIQADWSRLLALSGRVSLWFLSFGLFLSFCWLKSLGDQTYHFNPPFAEVEVLQVLPVAGIILWAILMGIQFVLWWHLPNRRAALGAFLWGWRRMCATYFVAALWLYLLSVLALLPFWSAFDARFAIVVQKGEMALAREQLGL